MFWGKLPAEWKLPAETVLDGSKLFLSLCREAFSKPATPLDAAISRVLGLEPNNKLIREVLTAYNQSGELVEWADWTAQCFALTAQFLAPMPTLDEIDDDDVLALVTYGGRTNVLTLTLVDPPVQAYGALSVFLGGAARMPADQRLKYNARADQPFTPVQLATARVLFRSLRRC